MHATKSLAAALRSFREEETDIILWEDAIWINRQDIAERNQEVSIMGDIYRRALTVLIWLGGDKDEHPVQWASDTMPILLEKLYPRRKISRNLSLIG